MDKWKKKDYEKYIIFYRNVQIIWGAEKMAEGPEKAESWKGIKYRVINMHFSAWYAEIIFILVKVWFYQIFFTWRKNGFLHTSNIIQTEELYLYV